MANFKNLSYQISDIEEVLPQMSQEDMAKLNGSRKVAIIQLRQGIRFVFFKAISETAQYYKQRVIVGFDYDYWYKLFEYGDDRDIEDCPISLQSVICVLDNGREAAETELLKRYRARNDEFCAYKRRNEWMKVFSEIDITGVFDIVSTLPDDTDLRWCYDSIYCDGMEVCNMTFEQSRVLDYVTKQIVKNKEELWLVNPHHLFPSEGDRGYYFSLDRLKALLTECAKTEKGRLAVWSDMDNTDVDDIVRMYLLTMLAYGQYEPPCGRAEEQDSITPSRFLAGLECVDLTEPEEELKIVGWSSEWLNEEPDYDDDWDEDEDYEDDEDEDDWDDYEDDDIREDCRNVIEHNNWTGTSVPEGLWYCTHKKPSDYEYKSGCVCSNKTGECWSNQNHTDKFVLLNGDYIRLWQEALTKAGEI